VEINLKAEWRRSDDQGISNVRPPQVQIDNFGVLNIQPGFNHCGSGPEASSRSLI